MPRRLVAVSATSVFAAIVGMIAGLIVTGTMTASAATFTYDDHFIARSEVRAFPYLDASTVQSSAASEGSASPAADRRGTSTPPAASVATEAALPDLSLDSAQLEAKFKHAADFGVTDPRGSAGFESFGKAVDSFIGDSSTVRTLGTYRGDPAILNYNPTTAQVVVQGTDGSFISGWKMSPAQLQHVIQDGSLGGG